MPQPGPLSIFWLHLQKLDPPDRTVTGGLGIPRVVLWYKGQYQDCAAQSLARAAKAGPYFVPCAAIACRYLRPASSGPDSRAASTCRFSGPCRAQVTPPRTFWCLLTAVRATHGAACLELATAAAPPQVNKPGAMPATSQNTVAGMPRTSCSRDSGGPSKQGQPSMQHLRTTHVVAFEEHQTYITP
jgi:hypothetical protein